uniref:Uncharacterized protein n=1 Tax=Megaviridae environmental sample TaxID=1737588 RepID=A0A5J6VMD0_9VIRU|nr:MAG: hypothetical protein [Megaviridae environmental sample]
MSFASKKVSLILLSACVGFSNSCSPVSLQTDPPLNITEYISKSWYVQQQQLNGYQSLNDLYCVTATYNVDKNSHVPFFDGTVISVYNYANRGKVNGQYTNNSTVLCAREPNSSAPEKLLVAPCFLPNIFGGNYWILAAGPISYNYEWAVIIGGEPSVRVTNETCTTKESGVNGAGLWLFSREQVLEQSKLDVMRNILMKNNISTSKLYNVSQMGCNYTNAFLKE